MHKGRAQEQGRVPAPKPAPILLVEDNDDDALLLQIAFQKTGCHIHLVRVDNTDAALRYLCGLEPYSDRNQFPFPRFMLLDLRLPGMDGFELLREIRGSGALKTFPVIALSSCQSPAEVRRAFDLGVTSFLPKPSGTGDLAASAKQIAELCHWQDTAPSGPSPTSLGIPLPGQVLPPA